jgi:hypothetical protein
MTQLPATTRQRSHAPTALDEAMDRMAAILEQETALLRENRVVELTEFNHRKRQGLLEINRLLRNFAPGDAERVAPSRVCRLAALLDDNQRMLAHHLKAVDEIASLVARAMQEADSDGTYGRGGA